MKNHLFLLALLLPLGILAQTFEDISFQHEGMTMYGRVWLPNRSNPPVIIINPGSGANDRFGTIPMIGGSTACLYPNLENDTIRTYRDLATHLADSGYAVFTYDKIEYTYPTNLGIITFEKLWLPVKSAISYLKTRADIDTSSIILLGHSEGSTIIPHIAKNRNDIKALISVAGPRTPIDTLIAYQLLYIATECGGSISQAQSQGNQIVAYFDMVRNGTWNAATPSLFGVKPEVWYDYIQMADSVSINYNLCNLPSLFLGFEKDFNVPLTELQRFENEVIVTNDFWEIANTNHYGTTNDYPIVNKTITDTILYWLRTKVLSVGTTDYTSNSVHLYPIPLTDFLYLDINQKAKKAKAALYSSTGECLWKEDILSSDKVKIPMMQYPNGVYILKTDIDGKISTRKLLK